MSCHRLRESSNSELPLPKLVLNNPIAIAQMLQPRNAAGAANNLNPPAQAIDLQHQVQVALDHPLRISIHDDHSTTADAQGHFVFEHVVPGRIVATCVIVNRHGNSKTFTSCYGALVDIAPGETGQVMIGGTGAPLSGELICPTATASNSIGATPMR